MTFAIMKTHFTKQIRNAEKYRDLKVCVRYFLSNLYFSPNDSPLETTKNVFYFILKALFVLEIFKFLYFCLPSFSPYQPLR